jgi:hypothetical protein
MKISILFTIHICFSMNHEIQIYENAHPIDNHLSEKVACAYFDKDHEMYEHILPHIHTTIKELRVTETTVEQYGTILPTAINTLFKEEKSKQDDLQKKLDYSIRRTKMALYGNIATALISSGVTAGVTLAIYFNKE